jgi:Fur family ferric uptake transcriptional regulator
VQGEFGVADHTEGGLSVGAAKEILRGAKLRCTAARIAVLQQLAARSTPLSHQEVTDSLAEFGFDQSTIYRSLSEMADVGLLSRLDLGDQVRRFEIRSSSSKGEFEHPHFMCVDCGKVTCLSDFRVQLYPSKGPRRQALGEITEVLIKGHCGECAS